MDILVYNYIYLYMKNFFQVIGISKTWFINLWIVETKQLLRTYINVN